MKRNLIIASIIILGITIVGMGLQGFTALAEENVISYSVVIPQSQMSAIGSSEDANIETEYSAIFSIDGDESTIWNSKSLGASNKLPQHITLSLGGDYIINKITYLPIQSGKANGIITKYELQVSRDGENFKTIKSGSLINHSTLKVIEFNEVEATHVRLIALEGSFGVASVAELNVYKENEEIVK